MSRRRWPWRRRGPLAALFAALSICFTAVPVHPQTRFDGFGRVVAIDGARRAVVLDHDAIVGLMPAQRTEFPVAQPDLLQSAKPGDMVRFSLVATEATHGVLAVSFLSPQPAAGDVSHLAPKAGGVGAEVRTPLGSSAAPTQSTSGDLLPSVLLVLLAAVLTLALVDGYYLRRGLRAARRELAAREAETQDRGRSLHDARRVLEITWAVQHGYVRDVQRLTEAIRAACRAPDTSMPSGPASHLAVVRHGETELFQALEGQLGAPGQVRVLWDRRLGERRSLRQTTIEERRRGDRRSPPPDTWAALGLVFVAQRDGN